MDLPGTSGEREGDPAVVMVMDNYDLYLHGGIDPGIEENYTLVESVEVKVPERDFSELENKFLSPSEDEESSSATSLSYFSIDYQSPATSDQSYLIALPSELIDHVLSFLTPTELVSIASTCLLLSTHAKSDLAWQRHVQDNVPGVQITSPYPCKSFRELYIAHDPAWFLSKYKIWFCDYFLTGKIIIARYDPRRGCLEAYRLVGHRPAPTFDPWEADDEVLVHSFNPKVYLHLDQPVIQLDARIPDSSSSGRSRPSSQFSVETSMQITERNNHGVFSNFLLARTVQDRSSRKLWPPPTIPARQRVRNAGHEAFTGSGHSPQKRSDISTQAFRIRKWMEMSNRNAPGVHLGEEVYTYATLDPRLYTPTKDKPYRGIWVADFSGHGCEFLLLNQPDDAEPFDEAAVVQKEDETVEEWEQRKKDERIYRGSLEGIKLTGDPNVPRGEYTFITDDISEKGLVRTATEEKFKGARIVKSRGHIAARNFRDDKYIESQLIMISHDRLAQYWVPFGHISYYERVNIDQFLSPFDDPKPEVKCP